MPRSSPRTRNVVPGSSAIFNRRVSSRRVALIVASAMFMEQMDGTVLATALPTMAHSFHTSALHMNVALTSYILSLAVFIPASGKIADRFGMSAVFRGAIALFTFGSVLCALAPDLSLLVAARVVQGIGGAMMIPVGRLVLLQTNSKSELVTAMAWLQVAATCGPCLGPPVGGFIVTHFAWNWIFYINVPIGILGFVLTSLYIKDVRKAGPVRFDFIGMALSGVALASLMCGIELASRGFGSYFVALTLMVLGGAATILYCGHARRHPHPTLDFRLMRIPTFRISVLAGTCSRIVAGAVPFLLPMMLQLGFGLSAEQSGVITFSSAAGSLAMKAAAPRVLRWIGFRTTMVWVGLGATLFSAGIAFFRPDWPMPLIYGVLLIGGFLQALQFMAYNTVAYADVPSAQMSAATSFYATFQQLALGLGIALSAASLGLSSRLFRHSTLHFSDFTGAFLVVSAVALVAPLLSVRMKRNAGDELIWRHAS